MVSFKAIVIDPVGMHARPAALVVEEAGKYVSEIKIKIFDEEEEREGNLKSIMNVMSLVIKTGAEIEIVADGVDENLAIINIEKVLRDNKVI